MASNNGNQYSPELREAAVREVIEKSRSIQDVAREIGTSTQTVRNWVNAWRVDHPSEDSDAELTLTERARLKELERENRELRQENEFLGKATAFFAKKHK